LDKAAIAVCAGDEVPEIRTLAQDPSPWHEDILTTTACCFMPGRHMAPTDAVPADHLNVSTLRPAEPHCFTFLERDGSMLASVNQVAQDHWWIHYAAEI
jgi:hypothetical protein